MNSMNWSWYSETATKSVGTGLSRLRLLGAYNGDENSIIQPVEVVMVMKIAIQCSACRADDYSKLHTDWC